MRLRSRLVLIPALALLTAAAIGGYTVRDSQAGTMGSHITVTKSPSVATVPVGGTHTWQVNVSFAAGGPSIASFSLVDNVPSNFSNVSVAAAAPWNCNHTGNTVTCNAASVSAGGALPPVSISATASSPGSPVNNATVTAFYPPEGSETRQAQATVIIPNPATATPTPTPTATVTQTATATVTQTATATVTQTATATQTTVPPRTVIIPPIDREPPGFGIPTQTATRTATVTQVVTQPPAATATQTVTATATQTATSTATQTATQTATRTATATQTATQTATVTSTTTTGGQIPLNLQQQAAVRCLDASYVSGAQALMVGQTTRIRVNCQVSNPLNEPLDYNATVLFDLGGEVAVVSSTSSTGTVSTSANQVRWGGFVLGPGETANFSTTLDITPVSTSAGGPVTIFTGTNTTARTPSGGFVNVQGGPLDTTSVSGLLNGGFVLAAPGGPGPVTGPTTPGRIVTPVPAAGGTAGTGGAGPAPVLPRTGAGADSGAAPWSIVAGLLAALSLMALPVALRRVSRTRR